MGVAPQEARERPAGPGATAARVPRRQVALARSLAAGTRSQAGGRALLPPAPGMTSWGSSLAPLLLLLSLHGEYPRKPPLVGFCQPRFPLPDLVRGLKQMLSLHSTPLRRGTPLCPAPRFLSAQVCPTVQVVSVPRLLILPSTPGPATPCSLASR